MLNKCSRCPQLSNYVLHSYVIRSPEKNITLLKEGSKLCQNQCKSFLFGSFSYPVIMHAICRQETRVGNVPWVDRLFCWTRTIISSVPIFLTH